MAAHFAAPGSFQADAHPLTGAPTFSGPGWERTLALGDAAHGGQVVISGAAWEKL